MSLPGIIPASQLDIFRFYDSHGIHQAAIHQGTVLKLFRVYPVIRRNEAYTFASKLSQHCLTILSPNSEYFRIWVDINFSSVSNLSEHYSAFQVSGSLVGLNSDKVRAGDRHSTLQPTSSQQSSTESVLIPQISTRAG
ncbi:MAG: hypothetical protein AAGH78_17130 [Cyanobacteria bacterium P01_H01_bin.58]